MRPVNLIPPDQRRGDSAPLRTGPLVYVLLGLFNAVVPPDAVRPFALGRTLFFEIMFVLAAIMFTRSGRSHVTGRLKAEG